MYKINNGIENHHLKFFCPLISYCYYVFYCCVFLKILLHWKWYCQQFFSTMVENTLQIFKLTPLLIMSLCLFFQSVEVIVQVMVSVIQQLNNVYVIHFGCPTFLRQILVKSKLIVVSYYLFIKDIKNIFIPYVNNIFPTLP